MIYFDNVSKEYQTSGMVLEGITISIEPKEFVSIVGPSGAGKTTLMKLLLTEEKPTDGQVLFESVNIHKLKNEEVNKYRRRVGVIFQDFRLIPDKTAFENIAFAMEAAGRSEEEIATDVPHVLDLVDLANKMSNFPHELSGGEKQRVAIARAIINQPDLVIADEPTGNLDPLNTHDVIEILRKVNDLGTTIILTTHNKGVIDSLKKRVITLDRGRVIRDDAKGVYSI